METNNVDCNQILESIKELQDLISSEQKPRQETDEKMEGYYELSTDKKEPTKVS